ncbi:hypothetical protein BDW22DRAFT_895822 [Trametopsis cervina]|nr:hypothetical protein BDW22DRAFT_895822 [Trametopsis cervina]
MRLWHLVERNGSQHESDLVNNVSSSRRPESTQSRDRSCGRPGDAAAPGRRALRSYASLNILVFILGIACPLSLKTFRETLTGMIIRLIVLIILAIFLPSY